MRESDIVFESGIVWATKNRTHWQTYITVGGYSVGLGEIPLTDGRERLERFAKGINLHPEQAKRYATKNGSKV